MTKRSAEEIEALAERVEAWADTVDPGNLQEVPIGELRAITSLAVARPDGGPDGAACVRIDEEHQ